MEAWTRALGPAAVAVYLFAACAPETREEGGSIPPERAVRDLVTATTPLPPTATHAETTEWMARRERTLERLRSAGPDVGRAALDAYEARGEEPAEVRIALLDVAAHGVPADVREHLVELVTRFGPNLALRAAAAQLLAATSPERAVEILEPLLVERDRRGTYPPEEKLLAAWLSAQRALGADPTEVLVRMATDLTEVPSARHLAVRELAGTTSPRARQALEQLVVESNSGYLRRLATQSLVRTLTADELCPLLSRILEREADEAFAVFLLDVIERTCP